MPRLPGTRNALPIIAYCLLLAAIPLTLADYPRDLASSDPDVADEIRPWRPRTILDDDIRGIYVTSWVAGSKRVWQLLDLVDRTELNAVVIDIKDWSGKIAYDSHVPLANSLHTEELRIRNLPRLLDECFRRGVYTIARIAVFQDDELARKRPDLAVQRSDGKTWTDRKGIAWVDPAAREAWDYNIALALDAAEAGFDEVQFDYVRFPSDGNMGSIVYPVYDEDASRTSVIRAFLKEASRRIREERGIPLSIDLFGLTLWAEDDLGIGQEVAEIKEFADFICPMVYPSHFARGFEGYKNPAAHPFEVIYKSCLRGHELLGLDRPKLRPWLQDFDLGAEYGPRMVRAEIDAADSAETSGWVLWSPRNVYTEGALQEDRGR